MRKYETKIGKIIAKEFDSGLEMSVFLYILDNGIENTKEITDEEISQTKGCLIITDEVAQALKRCAREICRNCNSVEIMQYIRMYVYMKPAVHELEFYKDECSENMWDAIINALCLDEYEAGECFGVYAIVNEDTLREE